MNGVIKFEVGKIGCVTGYLSGH